MALTTRTVSWSIQGPAGDMQYGTITITPTVAELVDITDGIVYVQETLTYPVSAGVSDPIITTDNSNTNPVAGNWGYNITVQLAPGIPDINVQNVTVPAGGGSYSLATILNGAGL
jgi:hypothetical protein